MGGKDSDSGGAVAPVAPADDEGTISEHGHDEDGVRRRSARRDSVRSKLSELWDDVRDELPFVHHHHHVVFANDPTVEHHHHYVVIGSRTVTLAASAIGWNALLMLISEIVIEFLILFHLMPYIKFRLDFFALTTISGVLGYQTIIGTASKELDVTRNSLVLAGLVETFLIVGDISFLLQIWNPSDMTVFYVRFPFLVLTSINLFLVLFMYAKLHVSFKPDWKRLWDGLLVRESGDKSDNSKNEEPTSAADLEKNGDLK